MLLVAIVLSLVQNLKADLQFLHEPNFFKSATLQFITNFKHIGIYQSHFLSQIHFHNQFCPLVLDHVPNWDAFSSRYNLHLLNNQSLIVNSALTFARFNPRFQNVVVTFLLTAPILLETDQITGQELAFRANFLQLILQGIIFSDENPTYIFINLDYKVSQIINGLPEDLTLTSKFIIFGADYPAILLCIPCTRNNKAVPIWDLSTLSIISSIWEHYNWNLQNQIVSSNNLIPVSNLEIVNNLCVPNFGRFHCNNIATCTEETIGTKHNYSKIAIRKRDINPDGTFNRNILLITTPKFDHISDKIFNELYILPRSPEKFKLMVSGVNFHTYVYAVIALKREVTFETFIMPFDSWTWGLNLSSFLIVVLALSCLTSSDSQSVGSNLSDKCFWIISTFLNQEDGGWVRKRFLQGEGPRGRNVLLWWLGVWYSVVFLLGNFYQGALFSCMITTGNPNVPRTLSQFVDNPDFDIVTMSAASVNGSGVTSILQNSILPDLNKVIKDSEMIRFLNKLSNRAKLLMGNWLEIGQNISKGVGILSVNLTTTVTVKFPMVVLDIQIKVDALVDAVTLMVDSLVVIRNHEVIPFTNRMPWFGKNNFLFPFFSKDLGFLVQSGIYDRWSKLENTIRQKDVAHRILSRKHYELFSVKTMSLPKKELIDNFAEANPVSFKVMKYPLALCAICITVGVVLFALECIYAIGMKFIQ